MHPPTPLRAAADRLEALAARATPGDWRVTGLLASRPEVVAVRPDGSTEHVAEARAGSGAWIAALSPAVAAPLAAALRARPRTLRRSRRSSRWRPCSRPACPSDS